LKIKNYIVYALTAAAFLIIFCSSAVFAEETADPALSGSEEVIEADAPVSADAAVPETSESSSEGTVPAASLSAAAPVSIKDAIVTGIKDRIYTGETIVPAVKVYIKQNGEKILLTEGKDYIVLTSHAAKVGTAHVTVRGTGRYTGDIKRTFEILPAQIRTASLKYASLPYTGEPRTQTGSIVVKARISKQAVVLTRTRDYTVSYVRNTNAGTATAIITGKGNYTGTLKKTFKIVPPGTEISDIVYGPGRIAVKWARQGVQTHGYQLQCSEDKAFSRIIKTYTIRDKSKLSKTVSGLSAGQVLYLRVRTYKTVDDKNYYSAWSTVRTAKVLNNIRTYGTGNTETITVYNPKPVYQSMKAAVWSEEGGQDDLTWFPMSQADGCWTVTVPMTALRHSGSCSVHVYHGTHFIGSAAFNCTLESMPVSWDPTWEFADYSAVHTGAGYLYRTAAGRKGIVVGINAGHGTADYVHYVYSHPDHSPKTTGGSTASGSVYTQCDNYGMCFNDGVEEAAAALRQAEILRDLLLDNGYDVLMVRTDSACGLDVIARTVMCNNLADCHISLHWDGEDFWYDKGCFYTAVPDGIKNMYPTSTIWQEDNALGESIINGLRSQGLGIFESGAMETDLMQTSYSSIPSIDLELGNQCSPHDDGRLYTNACGILAGLNAYFSR